ncbi:MAG: glycyl-radical enzyme activating protein [Bacteroidales bacterium]|nr:glycyl-radical enzyme activating protein [Bacteroidales bacterium]
MQSLIFSVKRYSIHDGPGIRVTFFMKGCPLACWWCHNPEGLTGAQETIVNIRRLGDREIESTTKAGEFYDVSRILQILDRERIFIEQSNGGVTFSGGEPMMQPEFLIEALKKCMGNGYHTAVDTSGYSSVENFIAVMPYVNLFLFDIKHMYESKHIEYTGVSNIGILENLRMILKEGKDVMIRVPVIPGINDDPENLHSLREMLNELRCDNLRKINLLPYHRIGMAKYRKFNIPFRMKDTEQPSHEKMRCLKEYFSKTGIPVKTGG